MKKPETVKSYGNDRYDLTLGVVFVNGKNVIIEMVRNGLAEVYGEISAKGLSINPYCVAGLRQKYRHWDAVLG